MMSLVNSGGNLIAKNERMDGYYSTLTHPLLPSAIGLPTNYYYEDTVFHTDTHIHVLSVSWVYRRAVVYSIDRQTLKRIQKVIEVEIAEMDWLMEEGEEATKTAFILNHKFP